jgi:hypothetical protein
MYVSQITSVPKRAKSNSLLKCNKILKLKKNTCRGDRKSSEEKGTIYKRGRVKREIYFFLVVKVPRHCLFVLFESVV